ncbi:hypothetical protein AB1207_09865 [Kineococcus endophyticus]|uniref:Uncharacterized protein n=1 Tax=Kineococcus endophyticus TaxID=1181883 RepID=A0ABV3P5Z5_9ACTN
MSTARTAASRELRVSRGVAVAGAAAAVLHVPLAVAHAGSSLPLAGALLVMSLVCLPCAGHLWRAPSPRTWAVVAAVGGAVLLAHAALLATPATVSPGLVTPAGHASHTTALGLPGPSGGVALAAVSTLTAAQVLGCLVLLLRRRDGQSTVR